MATFIVKKTTELSIDEKKQIINLFNIVFDKNRSVEEFDNQYLNNPMGYSYHSMMIEDDVIVGHNSGMPCYYYVNGKKVVFACNIDTMIHPNHRGIENYYDLMSATYVEYKNDRVDVVYGFPNDNAFPLLTKLKFMKNVGRMYTYCLPYRVGGYKKSLRCLNWLSRLFCVMCVNVSMIFASKKECSYKILKDSKTYNETRYKRMDGEYSRVVCKGVEFVYKIMNHEGVRTAFIIDVMGKSSYNFCTAVKYILKNESANFDMIIYPGILPFLITGMIRIPRKYEPKRFNFTCKRMSSDKELDKYIYSIDNWDINLSNYDLI